MAIGFNAQSMLEGATLPGSPTVKVLVVGDIARWKTLGRLQGDLTDYAYVELRDLHDQNIRQIAPDLVLSPLMTADFDAIDVAERLRAADYAGRYCAVANDVPNADLIRREVKSIAPKLAFDLLILPPKPAADSD